MSHVRRFSLLALAIAALPLYPAEFRVNASTAGNQTRSAVAVDQSGRLMVVWESDVEPGGNGSGIYGRRFQTIGGAPVDGGDLHMNLTTAGAQVTPGVGPMANGFTVAWQDISGSSVFVRRRAVGAAGETITASGTASSIRRLRMAGYSDAYAIAHENDSGFFMTRCDSSGPLGEVSYPSATTSEDHHAASAMSPSSQIAMAWDTGGSAADIRAQVIGNALPPSSTALDLNSDMTGLQTRPAIAFGSANDVIVVWEHWTAGSGAELVGQRIVNGVLTGSNFPINTSASGDQIEPAVAKDPYGNFLVVWASNHGGSGYEIMARRFGSDGQPRGGEFRVNTTLTGDQRDPAVANTGAPGFIVTWTSAGQDGDGSGIYADFVNYASAASTLSASPNPIAADGRATSTVTLVSRASDGTPITTGGASVTITANVAGVVGNVVDHGNGTYSAPIFPRSSKTTVVLNATIDGVPINQAASFAYTDAPLISWRSLAQSVRENLSPGQVWLTRQVDINTASTSSSVDYTLTEGTAVAGVNFVLANGTVTFAAGETQKAIPLQVLNDGRANGNKSLTVTLSNNLGISGNATATVTIVDVATPVDANGDGRSDLLWASTSTSTTRLWTMNGTTVTAKSEPPLHITNGTFRGSGDFDGDGKLDVLTATYSSAGGNNSAYNIASVDTGSTQSVTFAGGQAVPGSSWSVAGVGDFNGDGRSDILLRHSQSGETVVWFMNGRAIQGTTTLAVPPPAWSVVAIGDFDANGTSDLAWRHSQTNELAIWRISNGTVIGAAIVAVPPAAWSTLGAADVDGDGDHDLVWQHTSGEFVIWRMHNGAIANGIWLATTPSGWQLQGIGDFDGNGTSDFAWRNTSTRDNAIWLMQGAAIATAAVIDPESDANRYIVAPR